MILDWFRDMCTQSVTDCKSNLEYFHTYADSMNHFRTTDVVVLKDIMMYVRTCTNEVNGLLNCISS